MTDFAVYSIFIHMQVISIILDPYYTNQTKIFKCDEYHAGVILMRIPTNLFGLPKQHKLEVRRNGTKKQFVYRFFV